MSGGLRVYEGLNTSAGFISFASSGVVLMDVYLVEADVRGQDVFVRR